MFDTITMSCPLCGGKFEIRRSSILTERQIEIALLAAKGMSAVEIGRKVFLSAKTVKNHLSSIYDRLELSSRMDLAKHFLTTGEMKIEEMGLYSKKRE
jgi:DNA-binding NarL/FixJ family response regulator